MATLGVTFGIATCIYMISFITGSNDFFFDIIMTNSAHVHIKKEIKANDERLLNRLYPGDDHFNYVAYTQPEGDGINIKDDSQIVELLRQDPRVYGVSPSVSSQVFYRYGSANLTSSILGIEPAEEDKLFILADKLTTGQLDKLYTTYNGIIMGNGLANKLNVQYIDRINAITSEGNTIILQIVGIFRTGLVEIDNTLSYATIKTVQKILGENYNYMTDIKL